MKRIILLMIFSIIAFYASAQDKNFYYYKDGKQQLTLNTQYLYVLCNVNTKEKLKEKVKEFGTVIYFQQDEYFKRLVSDSRNCPEWMICGKNYYAQLKLNELNVSPERVLEIATKLKMDTSILNVGHYYSNDGSSPFAITNYVWVQLKDESQMLLLGEEAEKLHYKIIGQNPFMQKWVMLGADKNATSNSLLTSQILHELNQFIIAEPDMSGVFTSSCVNDPLFNSQWGLRNTGQVNLGGGLFSTIGIDTRVCGAWQVTSGVNTVDIAIVDEGFENNHPDLSNKLENNGYNAVTGTTPTMVYGPHGTACAGIAAAQGNNNLGVSGVARDAQLMSSSVQFAVNGMGGSSNGVFADAISWTWANGAEVISNSWGGGSPSSLINNAISNALNFGRSGFGSVVLFSSGNQDSVAMAYPANSNSSIIAVGSISPCGQRKSSSSCDGENFWGSNYGVGLDFLAPGVRMSTTDLQGNNGYNTNAGTIGNYTNSFNGTSSACPHAAGIAALILSINPCLTQSQVQEIMSRTCQKVGGYNYTTNASYPYGTRNNEMGYGLLDAQAAVIMAGAYYLQNLTVTGTASYKRPLIFAGFNVFPSLPTGNYVTTPTANVTIQASIAIDFQTGCDLRGTVDAQITNIGNCLTW